MEATADERVPMNEAEIRRFLETNKENPHVFRPRKTPDLPEISPAQAEEAFGVNAGMAAQPIQGLKKYFEGEMITDQFGKYFEERATLLERQRRDRWQNSLEKEHPEVIEYLNNRNKLKRSRISLVFGYLHFLAIFSKDPELKKLINDTHKRLDEEFWGNSDREKGGVPQYEIRNNGGKIGFVNQLDRAISDIYKWIAQRPDATLEK